MQRRPACLLVSLLVATLAWSTLDLRAEEPNLAYLFPAGGQRGKSVPIRIGGHYFHGGCRLELIGAGIAGPREIRETTTLWYEGAVIPQPLSQQKEDYPRDYAATIEIAADAEPGMRSLRAWTSQGVTAAARFMIGDLPEIVEAEIPGEPLPVAVQLPLTINGRIFPREDLDLWEVELAAGETLRAEIHAGRLGSPLDAELELCDLAGRQVARASETIEGDPILRFTSREAGRYRLRVYDAAFGGLQHYVYRLTVTKGPWIEAVYPLGARRGTTAEFEILGTSLPASHAAFAIPTDVAVQAAAGDGAAGDGAPRLAVTAVRFPLADGASNPIWIESDDLPEVLEAEPNSASSPQAVHELPVVLNGRIQTAGDEDVWSIPAKQGQTWQCDLRAARLGTPLDGVLVITDPAGKEIARGDDLPGGVTDCTVRFQAAIDGRYTLSVSDRFASRGGVKFAYRLRITPADPLPFRAALAVDRAIVPRGKDLKLKVTLERGPGFKGAIEIEFRGLPEGITASNTKLGEKAANGQVTLAAAELAKILPAQVEVVAKAMIDGKEVTVPVSLPDTRRDEPACDRLWVIAAVPAPFTIGSEFLFEYVARGSVHHRHYTIERGGFAGPIQVRLADRQARHLQGVSGPTLTVPPEQSEVVYPIFLPPYMDVGRTSRTVVMAYGEVVDPDGTSHIVSYSSQHQNDQIVLRVDPGLLQVTLTPSTLRADSDRPQEVIVTLQRAASVTSDIQLELVIPSHIRGLTSSPAVIPAGSNRGALKLQIAADAGPFNMPLIVRATAMRDGDPVVGEAKLELVGKRE